jgi:hypothetical protein
VGGRRDRGTFCKRLRRQNRPTLRMQTNKTSLEAAHRDAVRPCGERHEMLDHSESYQLPKRRGAYTRARFPNIHYSSLFGGDSMLCCPNER